MSNSNRITITKSILISVRSEKILGPAEIVLN